MKSRIQLLDGQPSVLRLRASGRGDYPELFAVAVPDAGYGIGASRDLSEVTCELYAGARGVDMLTARSGAP